MDAPLGIPTLKNRTAFWLVTAILTGGIIMGLELVAFRLYAPYFGYSIYVWGSMISVVMVALSAGYVLGGWVADRSRTDVALYSIILLSGAYQLVILFVYRTILRGLWQSGEFAGTTLATLVIFVVPMTTLAATSPYVIRLLARSGHIGLTAGRVYALSTAGSIAGVLGTSFYLVPRLGTHATLQILCGVSVLTGVSGLVARRRTAAIALLLLGFLPFVPQWRLPAGTVWRTESVYNLVWVMRTGNLLWLVLNDPHYAHTRRDESTGWSGYYQDAFALGPLLVQDRHMLVLGMGAGGSIAAARRTAPELEIDAVEIDPKVVEAGKRFFAIRPDDPLLHIHVAYARPWLARQGRRYGLVQLDLYQGGPYVPFYLLTTEFFSLVRSRMADDGLLMMNVFDVSPDRPLLASTGATLKRVFPFLAVWARADGNHIVFAFCRERTILSIRAAMERASEASRLSELTGAAAAQVEAFAPRSDALVFTDDRAPVEEMTRQTLLAARGLPVVAAEAAEEE